MRGGGGSRGIVEFEENEFGANELALTFIAVEFEKSSFFHSAQAGNEEL